MTEQYIHPRQPDYDSWPTDPDNPIFERKRALLDAILERHEQGISQEADWRYLYHKAENFWQLFHFTTNLRDELETEIFAKDFEIEDLKRQLEKKNGG